MRNEGNRQECDGMKAPANDTESLMSVERDRLLSLIEFSQQSARLRGKPAATVAAHGLFALHEHEIQGLPGIRINVNGPESEDEIWLAVERLKKTEPPNVASPVLRPWIQMTQEPTEDPRLREATDGASLIAEGTHCSSVKPPEQGKPAIHPEAPITLSDYQELTQRGYWVTPQVHVGQYRIDMVVEGHNDARLAVECDGDKHHGPDKWADDMRRERDLRRARGWVFWRCFASAFIRRRKEMLDDLMKTLAERGIEPIGAEGAPKSVHTEHPVVSSVSKPVNQADVWPAEDPVSLQPPRPDVLPVSSISAREALPQPREPLCPPANNGDPPGREPQPTLPIGPRYAGLQRRFPYVDEFINRIRK
jgi:very-short-patch-repair endonuclease